MKNRAKNKKLKQAAKLQQKFLFTLVALFAITASVLAFVAHAAPICNKDLPCSGSNSPPTSQICNKDLPCPVSNSTTNHTAGESCDPNSTAPSGFSCTCSGTQGCSLEAAVNNSVDLNKNPQCTGRECLSNNPIITDVKAIINFLSAGVALIIIGSLIVAGIQYSTADGKPDALQHSKTRITNSIIALAAYLFMVAFLQWLIPGGIF